jgi:hypothetical protein
MHSDAPYSFFCGDTLIGYRHNRCRLRVRVYARRNRGKASFRAVFGWEYRATGA